MTGDCLISVGVDVGTATTKVVLSRLCFQNLGAAPGVPRVRLTGREILYRSRVYETPVEGNRLQPERLLQYLEQAYTEAGVRPDDVRSGGVIITGEAARKENARVLLDLLAHRAGAFVVATAGPHLEAVLAGRGSGAAARSDQIAGTVAAVDIGGGTANIAIFRQGHVLQTAVVNLGGRAVRLDPATGAVSHVTPAARAVLGDVDPADLARAGARLADVIAGVLVGEPAPPPVYDGRPLAGGCRIDEVFLSGGVAPFVDTPPQDLRLYGDIGPALGQALGPALERRGLKRGRPAETTYATVIGVGVHTLNLSGATIRVPDPAVLPLTNLPVIRPFPDTAPAEAQAWAGALTHELARHEAGPVAITIPRLADISFKGLEQVAAGLTQGLAPLLQQGHALVVITEQDVAAGLGLLLHEAGAGRVITLDELAVAGQTYIDIGRPLYGGSVVPVVVKTLIFAT